MPEVDGAYSFLSCRLISWREYLLDQALYLLSSRPNNFVPSNLQKSQGAKTAKGNYSL